MHMEAKCEQGTQRPCVLACLPAPQVHAVVTRLTGKVESLQGKMGDIHSRLGKVEGQNSEAGGPRGRGLFGGPGGGEQRGLDMFDMN